MVARWWVDLRWFHTAVPPLSCRAQVLLCIPLVPLPAGVAVDTLKRGGDFAGLDSTSGGTVADMFSGGQYSGRASLFSPDKRQRC